MSINGYSYSCNKYQSDETYNKEEQMELSQIMVMNFRKCTHRIPVLRCSDFQLATYLRSVDEKTDNCEGGSAQTWCYKHQGLLCSFSCLKKIWLTHLQVLHPVLTLGALLLGRLACLVVSLSDLSPDETSLTTRLMGTFWLSLDSIAHAATILCTEQGA